MSDVTRILGAIEAGDQQATEQLLPLVYDELRMLAARMLAREQPGQTLQATALVHEAYVRLVDSKRAQNWNSRGHFFAAAAEAMRRILVDRARQKLSSKRGAAYVRQDVDPDEIATDASPEEVVAVDEALDALSVEDDLAAQLVKLRYFAGFSMDEAGEILGVSRASAYRLWTYARAWLRASMQNQDEQA